MSETDERRVYDLAEANGGKYLLDRNEYREKSGDFMACDGLVAGGFAIWDRGSRLFPCIRLTGKPLPSPPSPRGLNHE